MAKKWEKLADEKTLEKTANALKENGINVVSVPEKKEAFEKVLELIPEKSEVMTMSSVTLEQTGLLDEIENSGKFVSLRKKITSVDDKKQRDALRRQSLSPDYAVGSVHAVTENGEIVIASNSGSQLPAYAFGAKNLIFVVGTHKIVKNLEEAFKRIKEHSFPLEDARARKVYKMPSGINKILIINKEIFPNRITIVFVKEVLGF